MMMMMMRAAPARNNHYNLLNAMIPISVRGTSGPADNLDELGLWPDSRRPHTDHEEPCPANSPIGRVFEVLHGFQTSGP